jgi:hypothetical protein
LAYITVPITSLLDETCENLLAGVMATILRARTFGDVIQRTVFDDRLVAVCTSVDGD